MLATEYRVSPAYSQAAPSLLAQEPLILQPERSRVCHVLYGILIIPDHGEVYAFLMRELLLS